MHNLFNTTALLSINKVLATEDITLDDEAGIPVSIFSEIKEVRKNRTDHPHIMLIGSGLRLVKPPRQ